MGCVYMRREVLGPLELELQVTGSHLTWVLGIELGEVLVLARVVAVPLTAKPVVPKLWV